MAESSSRGLRGDCPSLGDRAAAVIPFCTRCPKAWTFQSTEGPRRQPSCFMRGKLSPRRRQGPIPMPFCVELRIALG